VRGFTGGSVAVADEPERADMIGVILPIMLVKRGKDSGSTLKRGEGVNWHPCPYYNEGKKEVARRE
jgi:hypothetical protein